MPALISITTSINNNDNDDNDDDDDHDDDYDYVQWVGDETKDYVTKCSKKKKIKETKK